MHIHNLLFHMLKVVISTTGPEGIKGEPGPPGAVGMTGEKGERGLHGLNGTMVCTCKSMQSPNSNPLTIMQGSK